MDTRISFLKKVLGAGLIASGFGSKGISTNSETYNKFHIVQSIKDVNLDYVFYKLNLKMNLTNVECQILFNYYVSVWYEFNFPINYVKVSFHEKKKIIKNKLDENGHNFILGILYIGISRSNYYRYDGFILKPIFNLMLNNLKVERNLLKKNFLEDIRILFLLMRDRYYSVLVKKYLYNNLNDLLGNVDFEVKWFNNQINQIKYDSLRVFMNDKSVSYKEYPKLIENKIIDYIYSDNDSDKLMLKLLRHVNKKGLEISEINIHQLGTVTKISINSMNLNPQLRKNLDRISKKFNVNSTLVNLLCMIETYYGYGDSVSHKGARGPIQVMPDTYKRFTNKNNFKTASDLELIEAGILNLINFIEELGIDMYGSHKFSYIDIFMIGVSYNAGKDNLYNLVRKKKFKLTLEPINYHHFLYFLYSGIIEFK